MSQNAPVRVKLLTWDQELLELPPLRSWEILRSDGDGCDAISFTAEPTLKPAVLTKAVEIRASCQGVRVFTGLVDEYELSVSEKGSGLTVYGRGMAARLLDNQVPEKTFSRLNTTELLRQYVTPYGIQTAEAEQASVSGFQVARGNSALQAIQGFCVHAGLLDPMFRADGMLILRRSRKESGIRFRETELLGAVYRDKRYGVRTRVELQHSRSSSVQRAVYDALIRRGGRSELLGSYSGSGLPATFRTATERLQSSRREEFTLELTVPIQFPCEPGTRAAAELPRLGLSGSFAVSEVRSVGTAAGCYAVVSLRKE